MMRWHRWLPWPVLFAASCSSVEWRPRPTEETWRGSALWCTAHATVAARHECDAALVHELYTQLEVAFAAVGEAPPPPPLILVVGEDDPPLLDDPVQTMVALVDWQHRAVHGVQAPRSARPRTPPDASAELLAGMAKVLTAVVPLAAEELALPDVWRDQATWAIVVPSDDSVAVVADLVIDEGMAKAEVSFAKRLLIAPFMPWVRSSVRAKFRELMWLQLVDASCAASVIGRTVSDAKKQALRAALGVTDPMSQRDAMQLEGLQQIGATPDP